MKRIIMYLVVFCIVALVGGPAFAQQKVPAGSVAKGQAQVAETLSKGCSKEFQTFCKDVTPGEGRLLACLYAHEDKLSGRCEYLFYDTAARLGWLINTLTYVASECRDDLTKFCSDIKPGEGRLLQCIDKNDAKVSNQCKGALNETGLNK
jgi:hypothetical protein